jgi:hypothetical protein
MKLLSEMVKDYVKEHHYKLEDEEEWKLTFRFQLSHVHAWTYKDDEQFIMLLITGFDDPVTEETLMPVVLRCHQLNARVKQVKFFTLDQHVVASTELFIRNEDEFKFQLGLALKNLIAAKLQYQNDVRKNEK